MTPLRASRRRRARVRAAGTPSTDIVAQIVRIAADVGAGRLHFPSGQALDVSNLRKPFFPRVGYTKGDLMAYYARMSPFILPALADRPLVLRRFPHGIAGKAFYQQKAPPTAPSSVRVELVEDEGLEPQKRLIGGDLPTLLYLVQLGAISADPWHSRVGSLEVADYAIVDLDPGPRAPFRHVVAVARTVKAVLDELRLHAALKTSGATGLHVVLPLAPRTPNESARLIAQLVATRVVQREPAIATVTRRVADRAATAVYVDYLQNIRGKTVASVYSARARPLATVSTPLRWSELDDALDPRDFTIRSVPDRVRRVGDLWAGAMRQRNALDALRA